MDQAAQVLQAAHTVYARANETSSTSSSSDERPPVYKVIGISLAIGSGAFIGTSFVLKKVGLLKANEKYKEVAGEGYGYLKNFYWWSGMTLMIIGEICNFVAYAFTDAILVTPLGALSVVITTILSAIFLKERLSMIGKVACFLCIVGSVVIVMNAPEESSVANIQEMQSFVIAPGFLTYTGLIIFGSIFAAFWAGPRYGKKNMFVYISICSWVGGLSVVATQGLGSAIVAQAGGTPQFNQWFIYVLLVFVIATLLTEIIFLNKALNLFNAAMVTPTYYVYFTSTTIITSAILFRGFKGTVTSIVTVVLGFFTICSGVALLQLSKSAKDVPDTAVFAGDLDQIHTIAEQEQPETEPKADAIRGAAAIVRRFSTTRQKMEIEELKRLHEEKMAERMETVAEDGAPPPFEWDGIRRRRTTMGSQRSRPLTSATSPMPTHTPVHPPLGMSHFPSDEELAEHDRPDTPGFLASIAGTIRSRGRSVLLPGHPEYQADTKAQSPMHPVQLTDIAVPNQKFAEDTSPYQSREHVYGLPAGLQHQKTEYQGAAGSHAIHETASNASLGQSLAPTPPPHATRRQFSFQNVFRRHQADGAHDQPPLPPLSASKDRPKSRQGIGSRGYSTPRVKNATEEERLGLVKGDSHSMPALPRYDESEEEEENAAGSLPYSDDKKAERYGRGITSSSPPRGSNRRGSDDKEIEAEDYEASRQRWNNSRNQSRTREETPPPIPNKSKGSAAGQSPPRPPRHGAPPGGDGAFI